MTKKLRSGKSKEISDEEAIQNLTNDSKGTKTSFSRKEIEAKKNQLYQSNRSDVYNEDMMLKYHALYQKMRGLIAQQQQ